MSNTIQVQILEELRKHLDSSAMSKGKKNNPEFVAKLNAINPESIKFGDGAVFYDGYLQGNFTAVGEQSSGDVTSKRTISVDFSTETYSFIAGKQNSKLCEYANDIFKCRSNLHLDSEMRDLAENYGKRLARQNLWDLNFSMKEYRLNRFSFVKTGTLELPVWPMYTNIDGKRVFLGYVYKKDDEKFIDFDISVPLTNKQKLIIAAIIGGVVLIILLFILLK